MLSGDKWSAFVAENFDRDVKWIHFVEEGDDSFYVTGYYENGYEFGGYDGIRGRPMRFMTRIAPFGNIDQVFIFYCILMTNTCNMCAYVSHIIDYEFFVFHLFRNLHRHFLLDY